MNNGNIIKPKSEEKKTIVLQVTLNEEGQMSVYFGPGVNFQTLSHAIRISSLHLDNMIIAPKKEDVQQVQVSQDVLNKLRGR